MLTSDRLGWSWRTGLVGLGMGAGVVAGAAGGVRVAAVALRAGMVLPVPVGVAGADGGVAQ